MKSTNSQKAEKSIFIFLNAILKPTPKNPLPLKEDWGNLLPNIIHEAKKLQPQLIIPTFRAIMIATNKQLFKRIQLEDELYQEYKSKFITDLILYAFSKNVLTDTSRNIAVLEGLYKTTDMTEGCLSNIQNYFNQTHTTSFIALKSLINSPRLNLSNFHYLELQIKFYIAGHYLKTISDNEEVKQLIDKNLERYNKNINYTQEKLKQRALKILPFTVETLKERIEITKKGNPTQVVQLQTQMMSEYRMGFLSKNWESIITEIITLPATQKVFIVMDELPLYLNLIILAYQILDFELVTLNKNQFIELETLGNQRRWNTALFTLLTPAFTTNSWNHVPTGRNIFKNDLAANMEIREQIKQFISSKEKTENFANSTTTLYTKVISLFQMTEYFITLNLLAKNPDFETKDKVNQNISDIAKLISTTWQNIKTHRQTSSSSTTLSDQSTTTREHKKRKSNAEDDSPSNAADDSTSNAADDSTSNAAGDSISNALKRMKISTSSMVTEKYMSLKTKS
jgi:hypothetical protein